MLWGVRCLIPLSRTVFSALTHRLLLESLSLKNQTRRNTPTLQYPFTLFTTNSMAPTKAEKKPTEKKPVAEKLSAEKKPEAGKKISKEGGNETKKRTKKSVETYKTYIFRVLKQVHPDIGVSNKAMGIMNSFINDIFEKHAQESSHLATYNKKPTITSREIQTAVRLVLPDGEPICCACWIWDPQAWNGTQVLYACRLDIGNEEWLSNLMRCHPRWEYNPVSWNEIELWAMATTRTWQRRGWNRERTRMWGREKMALYYAMFSCFCFVK